MIEFTESAYEKLLDLYTKNLHISADYGSPPIFYWFKRILWHTN